MTQSTTSLKFAIAGMSGRMGQALKLAIEADQRSGLVAYSSRTRIDALADDLHMDSPEALAGAADAIIDFTHPDYSLEIAKQAAGQGKIHIIGTTGFSPEQLAELEGYGSSARIVHSGNMSIGVNITRMLVEKAASLLSEEFDIEIVEMHHKHKKDAPSGTSLLLADAAAAGRGVKREEVAHMYHEGMIGERETGSIGLAVRRGGNVVGEHEVSFAGPDEIIDIRHRGFSRQIYATGALHAAHWAAKQPAGYYTMQDVLSSSRP